MFNKAKQFIWNHRGKLIASTALAIIGTAYYWYTSSNSDKDKKENFELHDIYEKDEKNEKKNSQKVGLKSRLLLRVRRHFDIAGRQFFPTLRIKVVEVVDISNAILEIKRLRANGLSDLASKSTEAHLWDQIKVSSFVMLFTSAYSVSIVAIILRIQLHILAINSSKYTDEDGSSSAPSEGELKLLIESTFKYIFGDGLIKLTELIKSKVSSALIDWTVREKISVQFGEIVDTINYIRKFIEKDMISFVESVISVPSLETLNASGSSLNQLLSQTADILESQLFRAVLLEGFDSTFRFVFNDLRARIFIDDQDSFESSSSYSNGSGTKDMNSSLLKAPPLATLLPQLKSSALKLLPAEGVGEVVNEILSGSNLAILCSAIIDSNIK